jgi:antitoxin component HigA of HigAB toxin-antitoxin module
MGAATAVRKLNIKVIKSHMALKGDTYEDLAEVLGKSKGAIHSKLAGRRNFSADELAKMSAHYGVPIDIFFTD